MPWSEYPLTTLQLPQGAGPNDAAIIIGPELPPCMQADYVSAIFWRPPNSVTNRAPWYFIAQRKAPVTPEFQTVDHGFLVYDGTACGFVVFRRIDGFYQLFGADLTVDVQEEFGKIQESGALFMGCQMTITKGTQLDILDPANFFVNVNIDWNGCSTQSDRQAVQYTITSTGYTDVGAVFCGVAFTMPPSGKTLLHYGGRVRNNTNGLSTFLTPIVRTGGTVGSGTIVLGASDDNAVDHASQAVQSDRQGVQYLFQSTPGDVFNAYLVHRVEGGTGTFLRRYMIAQPVF